MAIDQVPLSEQAVTLESAQYGGPVRRADEPLEVSAWIHTRRGHARVDAIALAWTQRAVWIHYLDDHGREGCAWVWRRSEPGPRRPVAPPETTPAIQRPHS